MHDKYLGQLIEGEVYEFFDNTLCYLSRVNERFVECYEKPRASPGPWEWRLRSVLFLKSNIRTIIDMEG